MPRKKKVKPSEEKYVARRDDSMIAHLYRTGEKIQAIAEKTGHAESHVSSRLKAMRKIGIVGTRTNSPDAVKRKFKRETWAIPCLNCKRIFASFDKSRNRLCIHCKRAMRAMGEGSLDALAGAPRQHDNRF